MASNISKVTFSVPNDSLDQLDAVASALGVTRSAALSAIMHNTLSKTQHLVAIQAHENYKLSLVGSKRYTGSSKAQIDRDFEALILGESEV